MKVPATEWGPKIQSFVLKHFFFNKKIKLILIVSTYLLIKIINMSNHMNQVHLGTMVI